MAVTAKALVCASCLVSGVKSPPDAVTQISGTLLCKDCAMMTAENPGSVARDPALRARKQKHHVMRLASDAVQQPDAEG